MAIITWRHARNVVSPEFCKNFDLTLVICLKFVFIEMLDKLITYIVWWYQTVYQVLSVAWTNRITTRRYLVVILVHTIGSTWYKVLYHHTMYVMGLYHVYCYLLVLHKIPIKQFIFTGKLALIKKCISNKFFLPKNYYLPVVWKSSLVNLFFF
jgi:hypothetical protein